MVVLRSVRGADDIETFVPQLGVNVAFLFVLASVVVFLFYIHHIAQSIRVATIIASIGADTRALIERAILSSSTNGTPPSTCPSTGRSARRASSSPDGRASLWPSTTGCWPGWPRAATAWWSSCER